MHIAINGCAKGAWQSQAGAIATVARIVSSSYTQILDRLMSPKDPRNPTSKPSREERQAKALRENLARRKALVRAKRDRASSETADATGDGQSVGAQGNEDAGS